MFEWRSWWEIGTGIWSLKKVVEYYNWGGRRGGGAMEGAEDPKKLKRGFSCSAYEVVGRAVGNG